MVLFFQVKISINLIWNKASIAEYQELQETATNISQPKIYPETRGCIKQSCPKGQEKLADVDKEETTTLRLSSPMTGEYF